MNKKTILSLIAGTILFGSALTSSSTDKVAVSNLTTAPTQQVQTTPKLKETNTVVEKSTTTKETPLQNTNTGSSYYTNVDGNKVQSPTYYPANNVPSGATAKCKDGTYSFSQHRSGTCSHHGGVAQWL